MHEDSPCNPRVATGRSQISCPLIIIHRRTASMHPAGYSGRARGLPPAPGSQEARLGPLEGQRGLVCYHLYAMLRAINPGFEHQELLPCEYCRVVQEGV